MRNKQFSITATASAILIATSLTVSAGLAQLPKKTAPPPRPAPAASRPVPAAQKPAPQIPQRPPQRPPQTPPRPPQNVGPDSGRGRNVPGNGPSSRTPAGLPGTPGGGKPAAPAAAPRPAAPKEVNPQTGKVTVPPGATVTKAPNGGQQIKTGDKTIVTDKQGKATTIKTDSGTTANLHNGKVTTVSKTSPDGSTVTSHTSPTGVRSVSYRTKDANGHPVDTVVRGNRISREHDIDGRPGYRQRTTIIENRTVVTVYRTTTYRNYAYPVYVPAYYYGPSAYVYFGTPWSTPVVYGWGNLGLSSGLNIYFAPAVTYTSPDAYVADYAIGQNLQATQAAQDTAAPDSAEPQTGDLQPIPTQVRQDYVKEVATERQVQASEAAGHTDPSAIPGALNPKFTLFQSWSDTEADNNGEQCAISGGDFVRRVGLAPDANKMVAVQVASVAKATPSHCAVGETVHISVDTLQEWFNKFIESQQSGYESMVSGDSHNKFPPVPGGTPIPNPAGTAAADDPSVVAANSHEAISDASKAESEIHSGGA